MFLENLLIALKEIFLIVLTSKKVNNLASVSWQTQGFPLGSGRFSPNLCLFWDEADQAAEATVLLCCETAFSCTSRQVPSEPTKQAEGKPSAELWGENQESIVLINPQINQIKGQLKRCRAYNYVQNK